MKNTWRKVMAVFCAASVLMTLPGVSVYADDLTHEDLIENVASTADEIGTSWDIQEEDVIFEEPETATETVEPTIGDAALAELTEEPAETLDPWEIEELYPDHQEDVAESVEQSEENRLSVNDMPIEEVGGDTSFPVGDDVIATFDSDTGTIELSTETGGTLWADWLERAGIDRVKVKSIKVVRTSKKVKLPADSRGTGASSEYRLFGHLNNLTDIDLTGFDTSDVTDMSYMFYYCISLTNADFSSFNTAKVTNMQGMFMGCIKLTTLDLSSFNTAKVTNMYAMFDACSNLKTVNLKSFDTAKVTNMGSMFQYCTSLTAVDVSKFDTSNVTNMTQMFGNCTSLKKLDLRSFNTSKVTAMSFLANHNEKLEYLDLGSFDMTKASNSNSMITECPALDILITPKTITNTINLPHPMYDRNGKKYDKLTTATAYKVLGKTKKLASSIFIDVRDSTHAYYSAIYWAADKGITKGYSDGTFGIDLSCTRGEMVMFLWRYAGQPAPRSVTKSPFKDVSTSHTFYKAILWAYQKEITKGYSDGTFGLNRNVSRGESMMFLWRLKGKHEPTPASVSPFKDVSKNNSFYKAILWGYQKKITTGYKTGLKAGTFGINENCTRGQIVTFLYRARNL